MFHTVLIIIESLIILALVVRNFSLNKDVEELDAENSDLTLDLRKVKLERDEIQKELEEKWSQEKTLNRQLEALKHEQMQSHSVIEMLVKDNECISPLDRPSKLSL